ncbi:MAG: hypothetical protein HY318_15450 [Armatimonadetes bacterium]|nr:hypothetical protein [Armatimonadota bacterium]
MQAIRYATEVKARGNVVLPRVPARPGTPVEVIVLIPNPEIESHDLVSAATSSLAFWDNPVDDEVWNDA